MTYIASWKKSFVYSDYTEVSYCKSSWQQVSIGSGYGLSLNMLQAITWTNDDQVLQYNNCEWNLQPTDCHITTKHW